MNRYQVDLSFHKKELKFQCKGQDFITPIKKSCISFASSNHNPEKYEINTAIMIWKQVSHQLDQNYQLSEIRAFLRITEDIGMVKKNLDKMKVETEILGYEENFDSEMTWKDEVDIELNNILEEYNSAEALVAEAEKSRRTYEEQSIHELLEKGIIRESISPWATLIIIVGKKDRSWRMCLDFMKSPKRTNTWYHSKWKYLLALEKLNGLSY